MTQKEFTAIMAYLEAGSKCALSKESANVYFDLLGDLPASALQLGARRVLLEHPWATFPSIAELRQAAVLTMQGKVSDLSPGEAWALAWKEVGRIDPELPHTMEKSRAKLPPLVWEAMLAMGLNDLCYGKETPASVMRGQFMKVYQTLSEREQRRAVLPFQLTAEIERQSPSRAVSDLTRNIGQIPKEGV